MASSSLSIVGVRLQSGNNLFDWIASKPEDPASSETQQKLAFDVYKRCNSA